MKDNYFIGIRGYKEDWYLLLIFILMTFSVVMKSYFNYDGYLSPDSTHYLQLAQNLLEGKGYYVSAYGTTKCNREFFAIWPVGYPTFIFLIAKLTGLSVFWASKLLNVILIGIILGMFRALFRERAYIYGLILLFSSYIEIFSYTWSETVFITVLLWFSLSVYLLIRTHQKTIMLYLSLMIASLMLFIVRYIGAFSFGFVGLLGLYYLLLKKEKLVGIVLVGIAVINISIMTLYLYHNYMQTGFPTGIRRVPSSETNLQLSIMLIKALIAETLIPITIIHKKVKVFSVLVVQYFALGVLFWKYREEVRTEIFMPQRPTSPLPLVFVTIGLVYLFSIIVIRWIVQFDGYSYRLLAPGSFLLFISLIYFVQEKGTKEFIRAFNHFLLFFAIVSYLYRVPYSVLVSSRHNPTYYQHLNTLNSKYKKIEKNSIVIYGSNHLNYLYTDMQIRKPHSKEKWSEFIERISFCGDRHIYLDVPKRGLPTQKMDKSVIDFIHKYPQDTLVKLR